jgi:hypothetical protein
MMRRKARPKARRAGVTPALARRGVLAAVLLAIIIIPLPSLAASQPAPSCRGCHAPTANAERWAVRLSGQWAAGDGATGTVPVSGQAYVAVGGGMAVVGDGLTLTGYQLRNGAVSWQTRLTAGPGWQIMSVRAWQGVVTAGVTGPSGTTRTEVVVDGTTGAELRRYPAAVFGGAVAASPQTTVVIGTDSVTSYDNTTGKVRWRRGTTAGQTWRTDGDTLYLTQSAGSLGAGPVTELQVIDLSSGTERSLDSPVDNPFPGTLAGAIDGTVLFTSASGVTAYSGLTGDVMWTSAGTVPEGTDPVAGLVYLTTDTGALVGVDPVTGKMVSSVSGSATTGSAGMYVVRGGVALGLDSGANGDAWGYSAGADRVTWTAASLPWPHYYSDLSGVGGSASQAGDVVVITACPRLAAPSASTTPSVSTTPSTSASAPGSPASPSASSGSSPAGVNPPLKSSPPVTSSLATSPSPTTSPTATTSPTPSASSSPTPSAAPVQVCADPELVALDV